MRSGPVEHANTNRTTAETITLTIKNPFALLGPFPVVKLYPVFRQGKSEGNSPATRSSLLHSKTIHPFEINLIQILQCRERTFFLCIDNPDAKCQIEIIDCFPGHFGLVQDCKAVLDIIEIGYFQANPQPKYSSKFSWDGRKGNRITMRFRR